MSNDGGPKTATAISTCGPTTEIEEGMSWGVGWGVGAGERKKREKRRSDRRVSFKGHLVSSSLDECYYVPATRVAPKKAFEPRGEHLTPLAVSLFAVAVLSQLVTPTPVKNL